MQNGSVKVMIPTPLRQYVGNKDSVEVTSGTVKEVLENLTGRYQQLRRHLYNEEGKLRNFVNIYVNDEDIRYLERERTVVRPGDMISIIPAIAGGAGSPPQDIMFSHEEIKRYSRHLILPEVGLEGQAKLKASSVLIVGAGGLGAPLGLYLAAAGVGRIGLVDFDAVESSNLQRQVMFSTADVGRPKVEIAKERMLGVNPEIDVDTYQERLTSNNALEILGDYDVVVDGTDNFPTRYLVNDACVLLKKPNVYGSIFRFEGQASVFFAEKGPCYRCLYAEPPPPGLVPSCAEGGVLGVLPGIIGTIQSTETIKLLLGKGETLIGRLLLFDGLNMRFKELKLRKNLQCSICGDNPTIRELVDYESFCGLTAQEMLQEEWQITPEELKAEMDKCSHVVFLDVREPVEYQICRLPHSILIPSGEIPSRVHELSTADNLVVYCHTGGRSARVTSFLRELGFRKAKNLVGGIDGWSGRVDPSVPRY